MNRSRGTARGFTLVELLVAVAILGILVAAIVSLTSGFLGFSRNVSVINARLADLNDAMGYVSLNTRRAMRVVGGSGSVTVTPPAGDTFTCSVESSDGPCIALVVPVTDTDDGDIVAFEMLAYRIAPLSVWTANPGVAPGWDGAATPAMFEYSAVLCTSCVDPPTLGAAQNATRMSLVIPNLFLEDAGGNPFAPLSISTSDTRITLRLRTRGSGVVDGIRVPSDGPLQLMTVRRP